MEPRTKIALTAAQKKYYRLRDRIEGLQGGCRTSIYALKDPRTNEVRYIGKAIFLRARLSDHLRNAIKGIDRNKHKVHWIKSLLCVGLEPVLEVLELCKGNGAEEEIRHIRDAKGRGARLLNATDGGDGTRGFSRSSISEETREKFRKAHKGRKMSPESRAKLSKALTGRIVSSETIDKFKKWRQENPEKVSETVAKIKRANQSEEGRKRFSEARKTWWMKATPDQKAKLIENSAASRRGKPLPKELRDKWIEGGNRWWAAHPEKRAEWKRGTKLSVESRTKISTANTGRKHSDAAKAKMSKNQKRKLNWVIVREIRRLHEEDKWDSTQISRHFGILPSHAVNIFNYKTWVKETSQNRFDPMNPPTSEEVRAKYNEWARANYHKNREKIREQQRQYRRSKIKKPAA